MRRKAGGVFLHQAGQHFVRVRSKKRVAMHNIWIKLLQSGMQRVHRQVVALWKVLDFVALSQMSHQIARATRGPPIRQFIDNGNFHR